MLMNWWKNLIGLIFKNWERSLIPTWTNQKIKIKLGAPYYADRQIDKQKESRELADTQYWRGGEIGDESKRDLLGSGTRYRYQIPRRPLVG